MDRAEQQGFDFDVEAQAVDVDEPVERRDRTGTKGGPSADELLIRIAAVQAIATRERPVPTEVEPAVLAVLPMRTDAAALLEEEVPIGEAPEWDDEDECFDEGRAQEDEALSVAQFYERVRRALSREFAEEVWVTGEIRGIRESRGHHYLELADHGASPSSRNGGQQLEVVCWSRDWPGVAGALAAAGVELEVGRVVRVRGKVSVWEGGSKLRFTLTALDIEALLGGIAQARRRLLAALAAEDLLEANRRLPLSLVPLRIGLVTSPGSEAQRDFVGQLEASGFAFDVRLEATLVQGADAPTQIAAALARLRAFRPDLAVVVRGGGARGDLAAFDAEEVARAIATAPFPVWCGIGHTGDRSVADEVAALSVITPTACGESVVSRVRSYWNETERRANTIRGLSAARLDTAWHQLGSAKVGLVGAVHRQLDRRAVGLEHAVARLDELPSLLIESERRSLRHRAGALTAAAARAVAAGENALERRSEVLRAYDPRRQLERGWSLTRTADGRLVRHADGLRSGDRIVTRLVDGEVSSVIDTAGEGDR